MQAVCSTETEGAVTSKGIILSWYFHKSKFKKNPTFLVTQINISLRSFVDIVWWFKWFTKKK